MNISTEQSKIDRENFAAVELLNEGGRSPVLLICEHASNHIPAQFDALGLSDEIQRSHIAWDPGALEVTEQLSKLLDAQAIVGKISRLVYDCNRPPEALDAVPSRSEVFDVPGNDNIDPEQYQQRVDLCFVPFSEMVERTIRWSRTHRVIVTIHSFTPVYCGRARATEIGILHDSDSRLADAMLDAGDDHAELKIERNAPYGPQDGVTYTLKKHGMGNDLLNVMIEVRNDLIATSDQQKEIAKVLFEMISKSLGVLGIKSSGEAN